MFPRQRSRHFEVDSAATSPAQRYRCLNQTDSESGLLHCSVPIFIFTVSHISSCQSYLAQSCGAAIHKQQSLTPIGLTLTASGNCSNFIPVRGWVWGWWWWWVWGLRGGCKNFAVTLQGHIWFQCACRRCHSKLHGASLNGDGNPSLLWSSLRAGDCLAADSNNQRPLASYQHKSLYIFSNGKKKKRIIICIR